MDILFGMWHAILAIRDGLERRWRNLDLEWHVNTIIILFIFGILLYSIYSFSLLKHDAVTIPLVVYGWVAIVIGFYFYLRNTAEEIGMDPYWMRVRLECWIDVIFYDYVYDAINGPIPPNVYELNFTYNHLLDCSICTDPFSIYEPQTIIKCGHRFHSDCLRQWEMIQFNNNPFGAYKCPFCQNAYDWRDRWRYQYALGWR